MSSKEEVCKAFNDHVQAGQYIAALTLVSIPSVSGISDTCLRDAIAYLLSISGDAEQERNARINAFLTARSFVWKVKPDPSLEDQIYKAGLALGPPLETFF
jgi:hypothetical protein